MRRLRVICSVGRGRNTSRNSGRQQASSCGGQELPSINRGILALFFHSIAPSARKRHIRKSPAALYAASLSGRFVGFSGNANGYGRTDEPGQPDVHGDDAGFEGP
jgi:hypothetical protein